MTINGLRARVLRGGLYLTMRQGLGQVINFGGVILLTRAIGPGSYGLYAAALGVFFYFQVVSQLGIRQYLVRREGDEDAGVYDQGFTLLLALSTAGVLVSFMLLPLLHGWVNLADFGWVAAVLFVSLPVAQLAQVPLAKLERGLDYKRVALFELYGLAIFYVAALPLGFRGYGVIAPLAGWWAQQTLMLVLLYAFAGYRPRLRWDRALARDMLSYGSRFSASEWVWMLRELVNPLIVGRYAGAEAVGYVALTFRFVRGLSVITEAAARLSMSALARVQRERVRLVRAVDDGMKLQLLAQGPFLVGFAWFAPWVVPLLFGPEWLPVVDIYPFIALGALADTIFTLHCSALYVLRENLKVAAFHLAHVILFVGAAYVLVPRLGVVGYGWAEVVAIASYAVIYLYFEREVGPLPYWLTGTWFVAFGLALFVHDLGWWAVLGLAGAALLPQTWKVLNGYWREIIAQVTAFRKAHGEQ